ncbi:MAG: hypothetical protein WAV32_06585 [Halobacteriota archaeon]
MSMQKQRLDYDALHTSYRKGLRNGNWRKLRFLDKALVRAAMWYARYGGSIVDGLLVTKLLRLIERLKETGGVRIFERGFKRASEMLNKCEEKGVFVWAPSLKKWLKNPDYIFWLGMGMGMGR